MGTDRIDRPHAGNFSNWPFSQQTTPVQPAILLDKALQILSGFPLLTAEEGRVEENRAGLSAADLQPTIILSEFFTE